MNISVPAGSEFFVQPRRNRAFGAAASIIQGVTLPSSPLTSMWIHACGLVHSIFVTVPSNLTGLFASNSAANAWCAGSGAAATDRNRPHTAIATASFVRIGSTSDLKLVTFYTNQRNGRLVELYA